MRHREPEDETIEGRVAAEVERRLIPLIDGLRAKLDAMPAPVQAPPSKEDDRFVTLNEASELMCAHRTTCIRFEKSGVLPPRRMLGGRTGWLMSEIRAALKSIPLASKQQPASLAKAN